MYLPRQEESKSTQDTPITFSEIEKEALRKALEKNNGNIYKTSKELNIARQTLYNKIQKHKL